MCFYKTPAFKKYVKKAESLLSQWHSRKIPYLINGAGIHSLELLKHVKPLAPFFLGFIDQSTVRQKDGLMGYPVFPVEEAVKKNAGAVLISSHEYQEQMKARLMEIGQSGLEIAALYLTSKNKPVYYESPVTDATPSKIIIKKKRRIAVVDTFFSWPPIGGSSVDLAAVMKRLVGSGFQVAFFLPVVDDPLYYPRGRLSKTGAPDFDFFQVPVGPGQFNKKDFTAKIAEAIDALDPEFVFLGDMYAFKPYLAERLQQYKVIWRSYNYDLVCPRLDLFKHEGTICESSYLTNREQCQACVENDTSINRGQPIFREILAADVFSQSYSDLLHTAIKQAAGLVIYNNILKEKIGPFFPGANIYSIPSGIEPGWFCQNSPRKGKDITILLPGRLQDPAKGFKYFLGIFQSLKKQYPGVRLLTTGKFDPGIEGVETTGWVSHENMPGLYGQADICVIPSLWHEPFGIVALEAMSSGVPVVANAVGGLREIILDGETGFLVPPDNPVRFLYCLSDLVKDELLRKKLGAKARERAAEYSWDRIMERYKEIFGI